MKRMSEIAMEFFTDPEKYIKAYKVMVEAIEPYVKAKKRMESFTTLPVLLAELGKQFPTGATLIGYFEKEVLFCTMKHEDWSEDKILTHVTDEFDRRLTKLERKSQYK